MPAIQFYQLLMHGNMILLSYATLSLFLCTSTRTLSYALSLSVQSALSGRASLPDLESKLLTYPEIHYGRTVSMAPHSEP